MELQKKDPPRAGPKDEPRRLFRISRVAQILDVPTSSLYRMIDLKQLEIVRLGGRIRVPADEVERLAAGR